VRRDCHDRRAMRRDYTVAATMTVYVSRDAPRLP
jgi:hypothetical protein